MNTYEQHSTRKLLAIFLTIAVIAGSVVFADHYKSHKTVAAVTKPKSTTTTHTITPVAMTPDITPTPTPVTPPTPPPVTPTVTPVASGYNDGSFDATSSYYVPRNNESIKVTLTLVDGIITDSSIQNSGGDRVSARYQENFAAVYKSAVVGRKISTLKIDVIAGASLTSQGFNAAVDLINAKAKA